jgi:hypothetical protein
MHVLGNMTTQRRSQVGSTSSDIGSAARRGVQPDITGRRQHYVCLCVCLPENSPLNPPTSLAETDEFKRPRPTKLTSKDVHGRLSLCPKSSASGRQHYWASQRISSSSRFGMPWYPTCIPSIRSGFWDTTTVCHAALIPTNATHLSDHQSKAMATR